MDECKYQSQAPDLPQLFALLATRQIRYVLTGSVAALLYGVDLQPGDLDITPALDRANLAQLIDLLHAIAATPTGSPGQWEVQPDGEYTWVAALHAGDDPQPPRWTPDPDDPASLDHLFTTRHGTIDIVPEIAGTFSWLSEHAVTMTAYGQRIQIAHIDDLLRTLTKPRRVKDVPRVRQLRAIQHQRASTHRET
jgi:hypothetical protein